MALVDTNCDPDPIDYVIACNDDALKSIKLILQALMQAIIDRKTTLMSVLQRGRKKSLEEEGSEQDDEDESEGAKR